MPYLEKLKELKESSGLRGSQIAQIANISETTLSRLFSGETKLQQFDTIVRAVIAMGGSLDEMVGIKAKGEPTPIVEQAMSNYAELLKEKDIRIEEYRKGAERAWKMVRHLIIAVVGLALAFLAVLLFDIANGHFGYFRY